MHIFRQSKGRLEPNTDYEPSFAVPQGPRAANSYSTTRIAQAPPRLCYSRRPVVRGRARHICDKFADTRRTSPGGFDRRRRPSARRRRFDEQDIDETPVSSVGYGGRPRLARRDRSAGALSRVRRAKRRASNFHANCALFATSGPHSRCVCTAAKIGLRTADGVARLPCGGAHHHARVAPRRTSSAICPSVAQVSGAGESSIPSRAPAVR